MPQAPGELGRVAKAPRRIACCGGGVIGLQQLVADEFLPSRRQRRAEITDDELKQQDAQRIDIGLDRRRAAREQLGCAVERGSARDLGSGGRVEAGDAKSCEAAEIERAPAAEIG